MLLLTSLSSPFPQLVVVVGVVGVASSSYYSSCYQSHTTYFLDMFSNNCAKLETPRAPLMTSGATGLACVGTGLGSLYCWLPVRTRPAEEVEVAEDDCEAWDG